MYGIYFSYKNDDKEYLIERFSTKEEAEMVKEKYVVDKGERVRVKPIK
jgi:hypothetical protein